MPFASVLLLPLLCAAPQSAPQITAIVRESLEVADARWHAATPIADGVAGGAARFDADQARIDVGACPIASTAPFTLRCALRTTSAGFCTPLMARDGEAVGLSLVMGREPGRVSFEAWSWGSVRLLSRRRVDDGSWHRIEVAYDPASRTAALFVDDELQVAADLGVGGAPTARLRLGDNIGAHQPFAGDLDEVEVLATTTHAGLLAGLRPLLSLEDRQQALAEVRHRMLPPTTPSLADVAAADWPQRRAAVRRHVADALGLSPPPAAAPLEVAIHGEARLSGVRLRRVSWTGFPGMRATGWLWSPDPQPAGRLPTVLCPHGHWSGGACHPVVQARCAAFARFGWLALAVDSVHVENVAAGVNAIGAMTWNNRRAIDLLLARDDVDPTRLAVTGASGGGQQTYYLMALEDRLAAAAPVVMACYLDEILSETGAHCGCNHTPRLAAATDVPEMCAVFAPRPVFFGSVTGDWTARFPRQGLPELTTHWLRLGGAPPPSRHGDEGHNYDRPMREAVYGFLHDALLGLDAAGGPRTAVAEPPGEVFAPAALEPLLRACPPARLDQRALAREYLARRPAVPALAALAPGLDLDVRPAPLEFLPAATAGDNGDGGGFHRGTVTGSDGVPIPFRLRSPELAAGERYTLLVDPRGAAVAAAQPPTTLAECRGLVVADPRPYGEWLPFRAAWQRNGLLLGRGEGYQAAVDIALLCASLPGAAKVRVVGLGEAGVAALLAASLSPRIDEVATEELGDAYAIDGNRTPLCPELLRFGDLPALVGGLRDGVTHRLLTTPR